MSAWHDSAIPVDMLRVDVNVDCESTSSHDGRCRLRSAESGQLTVLYTKKNYETTVLPFTGQSCGTSAEHFTAIVQETTENVPVLG